MKFRILFLSVCTVAVGATAWYACGEEMSSETSAYVPRSEFTSVQSIDGAMEYYRAVKSNIYTGEIESEDVINMRNAVRSFERQQDFAKNDDLSWTSMGPTNVGGRTRAVMPYPNEPGKILIGSISGGLFKSTDGAQSWEPMPGYRDNIGVSSIAILGNGHIYVSSGHSRENVATGSGGSTFIGGGLYFSTDDGESFALVSDFEPAPWDSFGDWATTNVIKADPSNENRLWVGTNFGLYPYIDGEADLGALPNGLFSSRVEDMEISASGQTIYVAVGPRTFVSTDFGENFEQINSAPYNDIAGVSSIDLAISPTDENIIFSSVSKNGNLGGIYASLNAGQTWNIIAPNDLGGTGGFAPFGPFGQGWYDNMLTVVPTGEGENFNVIMGGINMYRWESPANVTPGITLWEGININGAGTGVGGPGQPPNPFYVHSDIQTSAWDSEGNLYIGTDGGVFKTDNNGLTWSENTFNYTTSQYYSISFSPSGQAFGGLQDNGSVYLTLMAASPGQAIKVHGSDGGDTEISQVFPNYLFSTDPFNQYQRSVDGGVNGSSFGNYFEVSNGGGGDFIGRMALHENVNNEFSEKFVEYSPLIDDPYLTLYPEGTFELTANGDTIIGKVPAGTDIIVDANDSEFQLAETLDADVFFYSYFVRTVDGEDFIYHNIADTALVQEKPQFMMAIPRSNGLYITREALKLNGVPQFYRASTGINATPSSAEFSPDGDHLYIGYEDGRLVRFSGFNSAWTEEELTYDEDEFALTQTVIRQGAGVVTDIDVDWSEGQGTTAGQPAASERVAISIGNYGGSGKIRVSNNAASTTGSNTFADIWNVDSDLNGMPCYSVVMDLENPELFLAGTEYGIMYSDNNGSDWTFVNNGDMVRVPVFGLRQQKRRPWNAENSGVVYAGTHGRGVFVSDFFNVPTSIGDTEAEVASFSDLKVFPNPMTDAGTIEFNMAVSDNVDLYIYTLDGRLVQSKMNQVVGAGAGKQLQFDASDLSTGTYIIQVQTGDVMRTAKFVKSNQ